MSDDASLRIPPAQPQDLRSPRGTCRIGTDGEAVVDTVLRVHGISGVRVADASVMPSPLSANTDATVYAIAERAADLIHARSAADAAPGRTAR